MLRRSYRLARHQERLQNALIEYGYAPAPDAFVVVPPVELDTIQFLQSGVKYNGENGRQNRLAQLLRKCLAFFLIFLPVTFYAVAQNLVEKKAAGPPAHDSGGDK